MHTCSRTHIHMCMHIRICIHTHTGSCTHRLTHTCTQRHTQTHTHTHMCTHWHTHAHAHTRTLSLWEPHFPAFPSYSRTLFLLTLTHFCSPPFHIWVPGAIHRYPHWNSPYLFPVARGLRVWSPRRPVSKREGAGLKREVRPQLSAVSFSLSTENQKRCQ